MNDSMHVVRMGALVLTGLLVAGCGPVSVPDGFDDPGKSFTSINGGVDVGRDARVGDLQSVNGPIRVASGSTVGDVSNVNGSIRLEQGTRAKSLQTVNGSLSGENVSVAGGVRAVNGALRLSGDTTVGGDVQTINGAIRLEDCVVERNVVTVNGSVTLSGATLLRGDLRVKDSLDFDFGLGDTKVDSSRPRIVIHDGVAVEGVLEFEREVNLWVHEGARVGEIRGARARRFSGDSPDGD